MQHRNLRGLNLLNIYLQAQDGKWLHLVLLLFYLVSYFCFLCAACHCMLVLLNFCYLHKAVAVLSAISI